MSRLTRPMLQTLSLMLALSSGLAQALDASSTDPRAILQAASDKLGGDTSLSRMKMTIRQGGSTRERVMTLRSKRSGQDRKLLILIEAPADVRNTGFLAVDYRVDDRSDQQWLYLPGLHRVSRVPNSGQSDAFVGSDFSISDLSGQKPSDYRLKLLSSQVKVGGDDCWQIEAVPRDEGARAKTGYSKLHVWVSKAKQIVVQSKAWSVDKGKTKYFKATDIRQVDGYWTPHRLQMRTIESGRASSETLIEVLSVKNRAPEVSDADFTAQRLERGL